MVALLRLQQDGMSEAQLLEIDTDGADGVWFRVTLAERSLKQLFHEESVHELQLSLSLHESELQESESEAPP